jgi:GNAT superfamily N-acetyltransferase
MLVIKRFSELSFNEAISLWNESWKHYFSDMTMDLSRFLQKVAGEGISLENSVVAVYEGRLAGFVLNSFRTINGVQYAWNGGTAIAPDFRGMGIGKKLMSATLDIYQEQNVDKAWLEAIQNNEPAIKLYEKMGYETFEELTFLQHEGVIGNFGHNPKEMTVSAVTMHEVKELAFFNPLTAWQTQFASLKDFSCVIASKDGTPCGYAVYKKGYKETGELAAIILYQCVVSPQTNIEDEVTTSLLNHIFGAEGVSCRRITMNIPKCDNALNRILTGSGFTVLVDQVHMARPITKLAEVHHTKTFNKID